MGKNKISIQKLYMKIVFARLEFYSQSSFNTCDCTLFLDVNLHDISHKFHFIVKIYLDLVLYTAS